MLIDPALIPTPISWLFAGLSVLLLGFAVRSAPWRAVLAAPVRLHLLLGAIFCCVSLWLLTVRTGEGLWVHFLGSAAMTLVVGWRFALLVGACAMPLYLWLLGMPLDAFAPAWLLTVAVPCTAVRLLLHLLMKLSSRNLFMFMLGAGFGGGVISVFAVIAVALPLFAAMGQGAWVEGATSNWPMIALMAFPEGFMNGMVITVFSVFQPDLVKALDEQRFIER